MKSTAFDITPSKLRLHGEESTVSDVAQWLVRELDTAISARTGVDTEIHYAWNLYQQDRTRGGSMPWPDAADLTSPLAAEYVDALHARLMTTIFTEPVWTVEGWGESAKRAPYVEEFHQRAQEDERLQGYADEWVLRALVEGVGTLEVAEAVEMRRTVKRMKARLQLDETTNLPILGEDQKPVLARGEDGGPVEAEEGDEAIAEIDADVLEPVRVGPTYDVIPYLDFLTLPGHARNTDQVWGYAKRFWRRVPQLKAAAIRGVYDKAAVDALGTDDERPVAQTEAPARTQPLPEQRHGTAQKELWELQLLADFDGTGERWWRATVSRERTQCLRLQRDDRTTRYIRFAPFPKPGTVDRGYSVVTNKLRTVLEEDTAGRNLFYDRMALKASSPLKVLQGALWNPYDEPLGPGAMITVRDMNEVVPMQGIEDVPQSLVAYRQYVRQDAERALGQNDVSIGQETQERRTLGEVQLVAGYAEVRTNVLLRRCQEALEELFQARHTIWKRTLESRGTSPRLRSLMIGKQADGIDVSGLATDGTITAELLEGIFWGKPKGSVETADLNRQRQDFNSLLQTVAVLMKVNPTIGMIFQTIPAARSLVKTALKVNRVPDVQSILGPESADVFSQIEAKQQMERDPRMQVLMGIANASGAPMMPGMGGGGMGSEEPQGGEMGVQ